MVGGLFGLVVGCYVAITTRRFMAIPLSILASGGSFGFILGCGSMIRADSVENHVGEGVEEGGWMSVVEFNSRARNV
jgi:hypothetical protein